MEEAVYFVTTKTKDKYPYFQNAGLARLGMCKIHLAQEWMRFLLFGYVFIPDHLHIMIKPQGKYTISEIMHNIKRNTSRSANILLSGAKDSLPRT
ncbi:MAG: transposase [Patescibacteria group bacterium]|nr:transposase [Patescibacteria group bacterium]